MAMTLVLIEPRVASFAELHTFRCFACGDVRAVEQKTTHMVQAAAWPRPGMFHVARLFDLNQCTIEN
jgi:hypothetical protein